MQNYNLTTLLQKATLAFAVLFLIGLVSCKKDGELSPDFDDGGLAVSFVDTFSISTQVVEEDSLRSDLSIRNLLGLYNDPIFGPVSSSIYSEVVLSGVDVDLNSPISTLDSVVLTLAYNSLHGDTAAQMDISVYELSSQLDGDYFSNMYNPFMPSAIGTLSFVPNLTDSVNVGFDGLNKAPHIRVKLSNTFGQKLINADAQGSNDMKDNETFTAFMHGLYITTNDSVDNTSFSAGQGSMLSLDLNSSLSTVTIYYNDTSKYDFTISSSGIKYSRYKHKYDGTDIEAHLANSALKDSTVIYASTMAGVKTKIDFPHIRNLISNGNVVINKAELVVTLENGTEGLFDDPLESISLVGIDENGDDFFLPDAFEPLDFFGGDYDETTKSYSFNIARHLNDLLYNTPSYGMYIVANGSSIRANRSVFGSEKNTTSKIKLNITYSKL